MSRTQVYAVVSTETCRLFYERTRICGIFENKDDARRCFWNDIRHFLSGFHHDLPPSLLSSLEASNSRFHDMFGATSITCKTDEFEFENEEMAGISQTSLTSARFNIIASEVTHTCLQCSEVAVSKCSNCLTATYCSEACQAAHWLTHRPACKQLCGTI
jgi:hypothetical protein